MPDLKNMVVPQKVHKLTFVTHRLEFIQEKVTLSYRIIRFIGYIPIICPTH
jgi:hypothetical protein